MGSTSSWLLLGAVVFLTISVGRSARVGVGVDVRTGNDFGRSDGQYGRGDGGDEDVNEILTDEGLDPSVAADNTESSDTNDPIDGTETNPTDGTEESDTIDDVQWNEESDLEDETEADEETEPADEETITDGEAEEEEAEEVGETVNDLEEENGDMNDLSEEDDGSSSDTGRKRRAAVAAPVVSSYAKSIVGKTFNFNKFVNQTNNVKLTFNKKPLNLASFTFQQTDMAKIDQFLRGEKLEDRLDVVTRLAGIEYLLAAAQKKKLTTLAIEDLAEDDIIYTRKDVDELEQAIKDDPSIKRLNSAAPVVDKVTIPKNITIPKNLTGPADPTDPTGPTGPEILERKKRKITSSNARKWSTVIPYVVTSDFNSYPSTRNTIRDAVLHWEQETCLDFRKYNSYSGPHLRFRRLSGCWSKVGKQGNGQTISIGPGCASKGVIAHEIGHAIGFWHEQSRPDRSLYVNILSNNIRSGKAHNFVRRSWKDVLALGIPYDYSSVMHYGSHGFSRNGLPTITTKESDMGRTIGNRHGLSFYDVKLANYRYCSNRCPGGLTWSSCENDGYRDPKNCNRCKCPDGWTGTKCSAVASSVNGNCGSRYLTASSTWKPLLSPGYIGSGFQADSECTWHIRTSGTYRHVVMTFVETFKVQSYCPRTCKNYVEVRHKHLARTGPRYCCNKPTKTFRSHGNKMMILFRIRTGSGLKGFKLQYRYESCGGWGVSSTTNVTHACFDTQSYRCYGVYYVRCGWFWNRRNCPRYRLNTCYRQVKKCYPGFRPIGNYCHRIWGAWTAWSSCARTCGGCGVRVRTRRCLTTPCSGPSRQTRVCNTQVCPTPFQSTKRCTYSYKCGGWWNRRTCYKYKVCYELSKCCAGKKQKGNWCL